ncbi:hypothetical protein HYV80_04955, partial [Candidatus Woesearchaeota archaeon]|nr:hypothetical protein [Candidatus Woesearchaeota archaeon]
QNLSEVFIYGGLASIFVPMLNLFAAFMLLIVISVYDYISVFKTKHMVTLAHFQPKSKVFAGLLIPYDGVRMALKPGMQKQPTKVNKSRIAVLGGGDIGFTLIFAGVVMKDLMLQETVFIGFLKAMVIPAFAAMALLFLLVKGQKDKFSALSPCQRAKR